MKINRLFVVGDLHGSYDNLCRHLVDIDFDFKHDLLISVGDFSNEPNIVVKKSF